MIPSLNFKCTPRVINNRWDVIKNVIWQSLLEYAQITWGIVHVDVDMVAIYDDALGNYDGILGGNKFLYHIEDTRMMH